MTVTLLALLAAQFVNGGPPVLSTTGVQAFYVDPSGSDANDCRFSGVFACRTLAGAMQKIGAYYIRHDVQINVADGTYAENLNIAGGLYIVNGVTVTIAGTLAAFTVATGTNSGTSTASAAGSAATGPATMTDSGQSWTVNDLKGRFITFTSGALSGSSFPITANTATVITMAGTGAAGTGSTYSIQTPGAVFAQPANGTIANVDGRGSLTFSGVGITSSSTSGVIFRGPGLLGITNCRLVMASSVAGLNVQLGLATLTRSYVQNTSSGPGVLVTGGSAAVLPALSVSGAFVQSTTGSAISVLNNGLTSNTMSPIFLETTTGTGLSTRAGQNVNLSSGAFATCTSTGIGFSVGVAATASVAPVSASLGLPATTRITGCATGVLVNGPSQASIGAMSFDTVTTAVSVVKGGVVDFVSTTPTFTTVTNELSYDGTFSTFAALVAAGPPALLTNTYGSRFIR